MTKPSFIRSGHGYENHSTEGRCTAFDGFQIIAAPLHQEGEGWQAAFGNEARESRIYRRASGNGTDYGSHAIKLARAASEYDHDLYLLMHHGGGREVWRIPRFWDGGDLEASIVAMPERLQYSLLYTMWTMARDSRDQAQTETRQAWAQAIVDGRISKKRATKFRGPVVEIIPQWEIDLKAKAGARADA
ncbi:MAG TPA: hypothetical protein VGA34_13425 [Alteraurantiacibacter sp.]